MHDLFFNVQRRWRREENNLIHFIFTWGTIDSRFDAINDIVKPLEESCIPAYMEIVKAYDNFSYTTVCMKDSRDLWKEDIQSVLKTIEESEASMIIVTHGTYTMPDTARYVKHNLTNKDKVVIFIGSMVPMTSFHPSDGSFNIWYALATLKTSKPWVYIAMNAKISDPDETTKLIQDWRYVSLFGE